MLDSSGTPGAQQGLRHFPESWRFEEGLPFITVSGGVSLGNNFEGQLPQTGNTYQFADNFSKIVGAHSIKFGGDIRYQMFNQTLYYNVNGSITLVRRIE